MHLLNMAFQAFFQPNELERYLKQHPERRRTIFWQHVVVGLAAWTVFSALYAVRDTGNDDSSFNTILGIFFAYIFAILAQFWWQWR